MRSGAQATDDRPVGAFTREAALGFAALGADALTEGDLTAPLLLSTWLRRSGLRTAAALDALLALRDALLAASGLDRRSEPVPLLAGAPQLALRSLLVYLDGLVERGARAAGTSRGGLLARVAEAAAD